MVSFDDVQHGCVVFLEPRGINVLPTTILEVLEAVGCVLDALNVSLVHPHILEL
jgi:hypothetical protein